MTFTEVCNRIHPGWDGFIRLTVKGDSLDIFPPELASMVLRLTDGEFIVGGAVQDLRSGYAFLICIIRGEETTP